MNISMKSKVQRHPIVKCELWLNFWMQKVLLGQKFIADSATYIMQVQAGVKCDLGSRHLAMEEDLQSVVTKFFAKQDTAWYNTGIHKLISRYNKGPNEQGDYVEK